jgi:hypothetical protein
VRALARAAATISTALVALLVPLAARAAIIEVGPADDYTKIESAVAGDTVLIAPGTYRFRVFLKNSGTADQPIVIKAKDPTQKPVWDLDGKLVEDWPGSYNAGDKGRAGFQITGSHVQLIGLVIQNCKSSSENAAGVRFYGGASDVVMRDMLFRHNENGVDGSGDKIVIEFSEFDANGHPGAAQPTHNMYVFGGDFTLRYSYVHDSADAQNFHLRCVTCLLEYNWFARANNYEGDLMTSNGSTGGLQRLVMRGNVIVQSKAPTNKSKILTMYNDTGTPGVSMEVNLAWNTIIGQNLGSVVVQHANADLVSTKSVLSNNVIVGITKAFEIVTAAKATTSGSNNWFPTGATALGALTGTLFGASAGLDADFRPTTGSALLGKADPAVTPLPVAEYFRNESIKDLFRTRTSAKDLGAFESTTTGAGIGPYGTPPLADAGPDAPTSDSAPPTGDSATDDTGIAPPADSATQEGSSCGCTIPRGGGELSLVGLALGLSALLLRRR